MARRLPARGAGRGPLSRGRPNLLARGFAGLIAEPVSEWLQSRASMRSLGIESRDSINVTVRSPGGVPSMFAQTIRSADTTPLWQVASQQFIDDPSNYERGDRLVGGIGRDGRNWGPGYRAYHRAKIIQRTERQAEKLANKLSAIGQQSQLIGQVFIPDATMGFEVLTTRPFHPVFNRRAVGRLAELVNNWCIAKGYAQSLGAHRRSFAQIASRPARQRELTRLGLTRAL